MLLLGQLCEPDRDVEFCERVRSREQTVIVVEHSSRQDRDRVAFDPFNLARDGFEFFPQQGPVLP